MNQICVTPDFLLTLLDEVGRTRALKDHETDIIEAIVGRGHRSTGMRTRWTREMDAQLIAAAQCPGAIQCLADTFGVTRHAAYVRLSRIRRAGQ